jgi:predicted O-linked N-acetylglucosamine transferase (SPINDLY family)
VQKRVSNSILHYAGLGDLCVTSKEEYVAKAREVASDITRLRDLRQNLRTKLMETPLIDAKKFTDGFVKTMLAIP